MLKKANKRKIQSSKQNGSLFKANSGPALGRERGRDQGTGSTTTNKNLKLQL